MINSFVDTLDSITWLTDAKFIVTPSAIKITVLGLGTKSPGSALIPKQIHGASILSIDDVNLGKDGDAVFTTQKKVAIGVRTADCLPLLFFSTRSNFIMAMHAGWKGFTKGIILEGLETAKRLGFLPSDLNVFVGPAIGREAFEVGPEVVKAFEARLLPEDFYFSLSKGSRDRWHIDLQVAAALELARLGIPAPSIQVLRICTKSSLDFHSKRREQLGFGHNYALIEMGD